MNLLIGDSSVQTFWEEHKKTIRDFADLHAYSLYVNNIYVDTSIFLSPVLLIFPLKNMNPFVYLILHYHT